MKISKSRFPIPGFTIYDSMVLVAEDADPQWVYIRSHNLGVMGVLENSLMYYGTFFNGKTRFFDLSYASFV